MEVKYIHLIQIKNVSKHFVFLKPQKLAIFADTIHSTPIFTYSYRVPLDQIVREHIGSLQKDKVIFRIELTFDSKN